MSSVTSSPLDDPAAVARWPLRTAAHLLGVGLVTAVLIALPVAPSDLDRHQFPKETAVHLATWLAVILTRPLPARDLRPATWLALLGFLVVTAVSALFADNLWVAVRATGLSCTGVFAFLTARRLAAEGEGGTLVGWMLAAAFAGTVTGLAQAYGLSSPFFAETRVPGGTFGNRNFLAHFAAIALPLAAVTTLTTRRVLAALATALLAGLLLAAIVMTRSRAAWLGSVVGLGAFGTVWFLARRRAAVPIRAGRIPLLALTLAAGVAAILVLPNELEWRARSPYAETLSNLADAKEGSGRGRVIQFRNTARLALAHPLLGVGPGNWPIRYAEVAPPNDPSWAWGDVVPINPWPSSDWMALVSERGMGAMLLVMLLAGSLLVRGMYGMLAGGDRGLGAALLLGTLAVVAEQGAFDAVLLLPAPLLLTAMLLGVALQRADGVAASPAVPPTPRWWPVVPLLLGAVTLRSALQTGAYLVAGDGSRTGRMTWAARIDPGSYPIRIALAQRLPCATARPHIAAVRSMASEWPAVENVSRRCGRR